MAAFPGVRASRPTVRGLAHLGSSGLCDSAHFAPDGETRKGLHPFPCGADESLAALVAEHYVVPVGDVHRDCDGHWRISERWSYGEYVGWFVEHDGYRYDALEGEYGEDGPRRSREAAEQCMTEHRARLSPQPGSD